MVNLWGSGDEPGSTVCVFFRLFPYCKNFQHTVGNMFLDFMVTRPKDDTKDVLKRSAAKANEEAKKKQEKYAKSHPSAKELIKPIVFEDNGTWGTDALVTLKYIVDLITPDNDERNKLFKKVREVVAVAIHTGNYFVTKQIWDNELESANEAKILKRNLRIGKRLGRRKKLIRRNRTGNLVAPPPQEVDSNLGNSETSVASLVEDEN